MLEVNDLACSRGEHNLFAGLSFSVKPGELLQVEGANGSGKTTLLRTICGYIHPLAGEIRWNGKEIDGLGESYFREIAYLGHLNGIKDELNALENLRISCSLAGYRVKDADIIAALRRMGLKGRETFPVRVLSQGQRRRVALARLLLVDAALWILDEPLAALDVKAVENIQDMLGEHLAKGGMVVFTTHQLLEVGNIPVRRLNLS